MDRLRVRVYNVRFGDAILISVPDRYRNKTTTRHILIDVGNVLSGVGGSDKLFDPVIRNVLEVLDGNPLDLYIMTHEHLDHIQGLFHEHTKNQLEIPVNYAWLTASAEEDYYERHPEAKKRRKLALDAYDAMEKFLAASPEIVKEHPKMAAMMLNNNPRSTDQCVQYLRNLAKVKTTYIYRDCKLKGRHPFKEARFSIWAPEEDTSDYYGPFQPMALGVASGGPRSARPSVTIPLPPSGVDAGAFYSLVDARRQGYCDNMLTIDAANNNSSVVFCLEWRGWKLLFPGDAEERSWKTMNKHNMLEPVHFLKVGHHGSKNATPHPELLEKILPKKRPDRRTRRAAVSTCLDSYPGVPDDDTLEEISRRCTLYSVLDEPLPDGGYMDITFKG
jgi:beta-lactamase superfamily II metal-dependent hydrolase